MDDTVNETADNAISDGVDDGVDDTANDTQASTVGGDPVGGDPADTAPATVEPGKPKSPFAAMAIVLVFLLVVVAGAGAWFFGFTRSPAYSLGELAKAGQARDMDGVQKYLDIDAVIDQLLDIAISKVLAESGEADPSAAGMIEMMKPMLAEQLKEEIRKSIEEGKGAGGSGTGLVTNLFALTGGPGGAQKAGPITNLFVLGKAKTTGRTGNEALLTIGIKDRKGKPLDLTLRMKRTGNHWQVIAIENAEELLERQASEQAE